MGNDPGTFQLEAADLEILSDTERSSGIQCPD